MNGDYAVIGAYVLGLVLLVGYGVRVWAGQRLVSRRSEGRAPAPDSCDKADGDLSNEHT